MLAAWCIVGFDLNRGDHPGLFQPVEQGIDAPRLDKPDRRQPGRLLDGFHQVIAVARLPVKQPEEEILMFESGAFP